MISKHLRALPSEVRRVQISALWRQQRHDTWPELPRHLCKSACLAAMDQHIIHVEEFSDP